MPAAEWFVAAGISNVDLYRAWERGAVAEVPNGALWDSVRITTRLGHDVVRRLQSNGVDLGPVLEAPLRGALEFLVPLGTAASWPSLTATFPTQRGYTLCPPPHMTATSGLRSTGARRWIVPPLAPATTDGDLLCEAVAAVSATRAIAILAKAGRGELARRRTSP
ncbi:hypothetical protein AB0D00_26395 [Streptomyces sp. NPDC048213]|uniref:hypothetical protein n=1 Tax=Streptomyces sp. NPDC048213 TaxID=3160984 RepID=UPI0033C5EE98